MKRVKTMFKREHQVPVGCSNVCSRMSYSLLSKWVVSELFRLQSILSSRSICTFFNLKLISIKPFSLNPISRFFLVKLIPLRIGNSASTSYFDFFVSITFQSCLIPKIYILVSFISLSFFFSKINISFPNFFVRYISLFSSNDFVTLFTFKFISLFT